MAERTNVHTVPTSGPKDQLHSEPPQTKSADDFKQRIWEKKRMSRMKPSLKKKNTNLSGD